MKQEMSNNGLVSGIKALIEQNKQQLAVTVNATLSLLYWQIGKRIKLEVLDNERAEYGKAVIENLSNQLTLDYGSGWSKKQLFHCLYVVETFQDFEIVHTLCSQLSWSHLRLIFPLEYLSKNEEHIELLQLDKSYIRVADYLTLLPSQEVLKQKLHQAIEIAKSRIDFDKR